MFIQQVSLQSIRTKRAGSAPALRLKYPSRIYCNCRVKTSSSDSATWLRFFYKYFHIENLQITLRQIFIIYIAKYPKQ